MPLPGKPQMGPGGPPMGGPPMPPPGGGGAMGTMKDNMSIFNPADAAAMKESGEVNAQTTIRDFFASKGVDVDGPISQLVQFAGDQVQKANPMNKMKALAGQGAPPGGPPGMPPGGPGGQQGPPPDLSSMLSKLRG
jgi:hypothetical protein